MGYRNYIGYLKKEEYDEIKNFNKKDLINYKNNKDVSISDLNIKLLKTFI